MKLSYEEKIKIYNEWKMGHKSPGRKAMEEYILYYNTERINIKRKGLSPLQFRQQSLSQLQINT